MSDFDIVAVRNKRLSDSSRRSVRIHRNRINPPHAPSLSHKHFDPAAPVQMLAGKLNGAHVIYAVVISEAVALPVLAQMIETIKRHL